MAHHLRGCPDVPVWIPEVKRLGFGLGFVPKLLLLLAASTTATAAAAVAGTAVCSGAAIVRGWDARLVMRSSLSEGAASASVVRLTNGTIAGARCLLARKVAAGCLKAVNWFSRLHATLRWTGSCSQHFVAAGKLAGVTTTAATVDTDFPAADSVVNNTRHLQQRQSFLTTC